MRRGELMALRWEDEDLVSAESSGGAGSRIPSDDVGFDPFRSVSHGSPVAGGALTWKPTSASIDVALSSGRRKVRVTHRHLDGGVAEQLLYGLERPPRERRLSSALVHWTESQDARVLRRELLQLLLCVEDSE